MRKANAMILFQFYLLIEIEKSFNLKQLIIRASYANKIIFQLEVIIKMMLLQIILENSPMV